MKQAAGQFQFSSLMFVHLWSAPLSQDYNALTAHAVFRFCEEENLPGGFMIKKPHLPLFISHARGPLTDEPILKMQPQQMPSSFCYCRIKQLDWNTFVFNLAAFIDLFFTNILKVEARARIEPPQTSFDGDMKMNGSSLCCRLASIAFCT